MTVYESIYPGAYSYLTPRYYLPVGYQTRIGELGAALDPRTANQLSELNTKLNPGVKHIELEGISPEIFESIPEQHLEEMKRLAKLTGVSMSVHGPLIEASGIGERGWDEATRLAAEKQLESAVLRSHKLDPNGNISVTIHSTARLPEMITKIKEDKERVSSVWVIQPDTGRITEIERGKRFFPQEGKGEGKFTPEKPRELIPEEEINRLNQNTWSEYLSTLNIGITRGEGILEDVSKELGIPEEKLSETKKIKIEELKEEDRDVVARAQKAITHGEIYLRDAYRNLKTAFDIAYANSSDEDREKLKNFANEIKKYVTEGIESDPLKLKKVLDEGIRTLEEIKTPKIWKPLQDFVVEKSAETFANVALSSYKKFGEKSPIINIENPPAGGGLSRSEDLIKLIEEAREKFANKLYGEGVSKSEAKKIAEKLIGATWDVGHINMLRKKGYSEKDIIKETEKIAPYVKHVHLSDNFGLEHTELPMGMGNVPLKEMLKKLKEKGFEGKKIIEAGNWWQHFAEKGGGNPFRPSIEAFDSPVYSVGGAPYWSVIGGPGAYYLGHGPINPPIHHRVYGSGFETLPLELGGEIPGDRGRFSETPNQ